MKSQKIFYHFETESDLTYKAEAFISNLEQLAQLDDTLRQVILKETADSGGQIMKTIRDTIDEQVVGSIKYYGSAESTMENMARKYTDMVNAMKAQYLTYYYEEIEMNPNNKPS